VSGGNRSIKVKSPSLNPPKVVNKPQDLNDANKIIKGHLDLSGATTA
jgi:hypothetical protein